MPVAFENCPIAFESDNLVVLDVSAELPQHKRKRYNERDEEDIHFAVFHHSAGNTKPMPEGLMATAKFFVRPKVLGGRGWPGFGYHFYVPYDPDIWEADWPWGDGRYVIYQTQRLDLTSYHTKGQNAHGVGVVFQGSFNRKRRPSAAQRTIVPLLWSEILKPAFQLSNKDLYGHFMFTKPACPGPQLERFVLTTRDTLVAPPPNPYTT